MLLNYYLKIGNGKNIIFLHGWKEDKKTWFRVAKCLESDFTCWLIDLPGFGENPKLDSIINPHDYAVWIKNFVKVMNISEYFFVGHSFGGRIGIRLASMEIEGLKKLVLYGTPGFSEKTSIFKQMLVSIYNGVKLRNLTLLQKNKIFKKVQNYLRSKDYQDSNELKDIFLASIKFNLKMPMKKISIPTLIIHGKQDKEVSLGVAKEMQDTIAGSQLKIVAGTHFFHLENPLLFSGYLRKFFNE